MTSDNTRHRLGLLAVAALSLFGALFARLWFLQIVEGDTARAEASSNTTEVVITPAPRGRILDRNGIVLVDNRESIVVGIEAQEFAELSKTTQRRVLERLSATLSDGRPMEEQVSVESLRKKLGDTRYSKFAPIPVAEDISEEDQIYFSEQASLYPAVSVERTTVREYPYGSLAAHVLGYVGSLSDAQWKDLEKANDADKPYVQTDQIGKAGVEASYEEYLRGTPGRQVFEVDRRGKVVREITKERVERHAGDDLYLSIDAKVQYKAEEALQARLLASFQGADGREAGGMVILDHTTGQVRAMASYPTYEPADLVGGISCPTWRDLQGLAPDGECGKAMTKEIKLLTKDGTPPVAKLLNRSLQGSYPPASTFKLASSYAAVKLGIRQPQDTIGDGGTYRLCDGDGPGCVKQNAGGKALGPVDLQRALTVSSDVYFYGIGDLSWKRREELGEDAMQKYIRELGYGERTGVDLPAESAGQVPDPESEAALAAGLFESNPEAYDNDEAQAKDAGRWRSGFSADLAIGQKVNATPLQTANAYATLANGGKLFQPTVLEKITAANEPTAIHKRFESKVTRTIDWGPTRDAYMNGFRGVVDGPEGTAVSTFAGFPFGAMPLGGKTGTAQTGEDKLGNERPDNSLFVAFTEGGASSWTASAMLEFSGSGAGAAAPAVRMVLEPIADGSLAAFTIPLGGEIDAEAAVDDLGVVAQGSD
ncbi:penicillin-binding transpeptidase domain-containing protein [Aquihabitans daechungensis]|uniref:penicillin-binding transpeptidase domain-containing protein n=1 Tax=Aquihabitans daechungensis TaxID=1052257 RepID=UPI003BA3C8D3